MRVRWGTNAPYAQTAYLAYNILPANLTAVTLTASLASPQYAGTPITFTAAAVGGITAPNVQYQFYAQYKNTDGASASNILLQDWSASSSCVWTPTTAQYYYVNVCARPVGDTAPYAATNYLIYNVLPTNLTAVSLAAFAACTTEYRDGDHPHRNPAGWDNLSQCPVSIHQPVQTGERRLVAGRDHQQLEHLGELCLEHDDGGDYYVNVYARRSATWRRMPRRPISPTTCCRPTSPR